MPIFSIIVPTRGRGKYLRSALQSLADQTFRDFDVLVSDNASGDDTPTIVKEFAAGNLHSVRVEKRLSMADHWNFALTNALATLRGEYIGILADDDAFCPGHLQRMREVIRRADKGDVVASAAGIYREGFDAVSVPKYTGTTGTIDREKILADDSRRYRSLTIPLPAYYFFRRGAALSVIERTGKLYHGTVIESNALKFLIAAGCNLTYLDRPSWVAGQTERSIGYSCLSGRGNAFQEFLEEYPGLTQSWSLPSDLPVVTNLQTADLMRLSAMFPGKFPRYRFDRTNYFKSLWTDVHNLVLCGAKESKQFEARFWQTLRAEEPSFASRISRWAAARKQRAEQMADPGHNERLQARLRRRISAIGYAGGIEISSDSMRTVRDAAKAMEQALHQLHPPKHPATASR